MEDYVTIAEGARRLGITTKRIQRAIKAGDLPARYPHRNKAEIRMADLQTWFDGLRVRPGETQDRLAALEARLSDLEAEVQSLRRQLEASPPTTKPKLPKIDSAPPEGFVWLSDFCHLHHVPYQAALDLFPHAIYGQPIKVRGRNQPAIGTKGQHDFWVQLRTRPDFVACDNCPHAE